MRLALRSLVSLLAVGGLLVFATPMAAFAAAPSGPVIYLTGLQPGQARTETIANGSATTTITVRRLAQSEVSALKSSGDISPNNQTCPSPTSCGGSCTSWTDTVGVLYAYGGSTGPGYTWTAQALFGYNCSTPTIGQISNPAIAAYNANIPYAFQTLPTASRSGNDTGSPTLYTQAGIEVLDPVTGQPVCQALGSTDLVFDVATGGLNPAPYTPACEGY